MKPFTWPAIWLAASKTRDELMNRYKFSNVGCKVVFHSCRISNPMSIWYDKASIFCHLCPLILFVFAKLYKYFPLTPQIHAMSSHKIHWQWSSDWRIQRCQEARGIRQKPGVNLQMFILPFLIHPNAHFYKTGKNIITFETSASLSKLAENSYWVQEL